MGMQWNPWIASTTLGQQNRVRYSEVYPFQSSDNVHVPKKKVRFWEVSRGLPVHDKP